MYRVGIQNGLITSIESIHHLSTIDGLEGIFVDDTIIQTENLPANYNMVDNNITRIYNYLSVAIDKPKITSDGIDTATITATVDNLSSTELIELWYGDTLLDSKNAVNGVATFEITMTQTGVLNLTVKSTIKYGQASITIEGVIA